MKVELRSGQGGAARIGMLTISDQASRGEYEDLSGRAIEAWLEDAITSPWAPIRRLIPDGFESVRDTLIELSDPGGADLVLATGGTGSAPRDLTPDAMLAVVERELPGFGELMRHVSLESVPTAILSRQPAGVRGRTLMASLPGKSPAIGVCLNAVFPAVPYLLGSHKEREG